MKKHTKRMLAFAAASLMTSALTLTACGEIKDAAGKYKDYVYRYDQTTLKTGCDADTTIDGVLSEERWNDPELKWLEHRESSSEVNMKYTTSFSEKGLYLAAVSQDWRIFYNSPYSNIKNTSFDIFLAREGDYSLNDKIFISFNCGNTHWARGLYSYLGHVTTQGGEPNSDTCTGMTLEAFIPWSQFGYTSAPEKIRSVCTYQLLNSATAGAIELQPGYVNGYAYGKFYEFGEKGFLSADTEEGTLGDSKSGYSKGPDWNVSRAAEDIYTSNKAQQNTCTTGQTYIFFRDVLNESYSVSATFTPNIHADGACGIANSSPRAGLMTGYNAYCFSALMIDMSKSNLDSGTLVLTSSYTHGGSTAHNPIYKSGAGEYDLRKGITLTCVKYGSLFYYYVGSGANAKLVYQEDIPLLNGNTEPGIQTTNCDVTVSAPSARYYQTADRSELLGYLNNTGIYIVSAENGAGGSVTPEAFSVARGGNLVLDVAANSGVYKLDSLEVSYDGGDWVNLIEDARLNMREGKYVIADIRSNVAIKSAFVRNTAAMSTVTGRITTGGSSVSGATVALESKTDKTLYFTANTNGEGEYSLRVPAGNYNMIVRAQGFVSSSGEVNATAENAAKDMAIDRAPVGGSVTVGGKVFASNSTACDYSRAEEGFVTFSENSSETQIAWLSAVGAAEGDFTATAIFEFLSGSDTDPSAGFVLTDGIQNYPYAMYTIGGNKGGFRFYHPDDWWNNRYQGKNGTSINFLNNAKIIVTLKRVGDTYTLYSDVYTDGMTEATSARASINGGATHQGISMGTYQPYSSSVTCTVPKGTVAVGISCHANASFRVQVLNFTTN